jgi:hypothetical protein
MNQRVLCLLATSLLFGCEPDLITGPDARAMDAGQDAYTPPVDAPPPCLGDINGEVRFPNGVHAAADVLVYIPAHEGELSHVGECGQCIAFEELRSYDATDIDGTFSLRNLPPGEYEVVVEKGMFQRRTTVTVGCEDVWIDPALTALPGSSEEGRVPRIAVVTGAFDQMERVLSNIGLRELDLFTGSLGGPGGTASELLRDSEALNAYDYLFVNCGASLEGDGFSGGGVLFEEEVQANLRSFVDRGGRLYVTDLSYDVVEQIFPRYIDFGASPSVDGLGEFPEMLNAAERGVIAETQGTVLEPMLERWLEIHGALDDDGRLPIRHLGGGWAHIDDVGESTTTWVEAPADGMSDRPMTVTFNAGCGATLYTSYHTTGFGTGTTLSAQEMMLAYLAFEIASCVEDPILE